jgi:L-fuculose-phosphate aldolase
MSTSNPAGLSAEIERVVREVMKDYIGEVCQADEGSMSAAQQVHWSVEAKAIKREIVRVGRKLWERGYVDGNGGNISARVGENYVICTPTLLSKGDLTEDDLCLLDMNGRQRLGYRAQTSETSLHLAMYRANPKARAIVHCHPPATTAYAIAGVEPPTGYVPEYEVIVGPVGLSPYETPGTKAFADSVLKHVHEHNTILLANHGVVSWADTVTHAEWCVEVLDNYCKTLALGAQLGLRMNQIPAHKLKDLLKVKQKLGLPDPRLKTMHLEEPAASPAAAPQEDLDDLVQSIAEQVLAKLRSQS